ncbi:hypothetical protein SECTIM467_160 [Brevibacillus phage SecTim467]|uniref:Uncharacterized protein n=2 Tax=Jenstvirus jenst TaxID=1982225 RepID=A0A0K2CP34_9CAUD|nr:hypothetical protein AVV11_gp036 [Brevibacillus phage Jenst]ALA07284.1 hypothetical protein JENST_155 [Brevibacillus phage Jenst]ALA07483.1 hypothetical protein SECTIM467_160 [Brevibacillus phage SecTim467]
MIKEERLATEIEGLYRELGREKIRYRLALLEIERLKEEKYSSAPDERRANNIKEKLDDLEEGILKIVLSTLPSRAIKAIRNPEEGKK